MGAAAYTTQVPQYAPQPCNLHSRPVTLEQCYYLAGLGPARYYLCFGPAVPFVWSFGKLHQLAVSVGHGKGCTSKSTRLSEGGLSPCSLSQILPASPHLCGLARECSAVVAHVGNAAYVRRNLKGLCSLYGTPSPPCAS